MYFCKHRKKPQYINHIPPAFTSNHNIVHFNNNLISFSITTRDHKSVLSIIGTAALTASTVSYYCEIVGKSDLNQEGAAIRTSKFQNCSGPTILHHATEARGTSVTTLQFSHNFPAELAAAAQSRPQGVHKLWIFRSMQNQLPFQLKRQLLLL